MGRYLPKRRDQYKSHFSTSDDVRAEVSAPLQPTRRAVPLSWYTGKGRRSGLIISWDLLTGRYTTWLLSEHSSVSSGGRATGVPWRQLTFIDQDFGGSGSIGEAEHRLQPLSSPLK